MHHQLPANRGDAVSSNYNPGGLQRMWREMLTKSFSPRQWFDEHREERSGGLRSSLEVYAEYIEGLPMWVYRQISPTVWVVGFYSPVKEWYQDSEHKSREDAARRVHWLNGGNRPAEVKAE